MDQSSTNQPTNFFSFIAILDIQHQMFLGTVQGQMDRHNSQTPIAQGGQYMGVAGRHDYRLYRHVQWYIEYRLQSEIRIKKQRMN